MLTRSQVAKRLGKSIATVRRLEGVELFPRRDWRGVHLFKSSEVEDLRERIRDGLELPKGVRVSASASTNHVIFGESLEQKLKAQERRIDALEEILNHLLEIS